MLSARFRAAFIRQTKLQTARYRPHGYRCRGSHCIRNPVAVHVPLFILYRKPAGDEGLDCRCELLRRFFASVSKVLPHLNSKLQSFRRFCQVPPAM
jgi:hypothetical protein